MNGFFRNDTDRQTLRIIDKKSNERNNLDKTIWQLWVQGYVEGKEKTYEDSFLDRIMNLILECSLTNFVNKYAFEVMCEKFNVNLGTWCYFNNTVKKLSHNKDKGGDLWKLAIRGECTVHSITNRKIYICNSNSESDSDSHEEDKEEEEEEEDDKEERKEG